MIVVSAPARLPYRAKLIVDKAEHKDVVIPALARSVTIKSSQRRIGQIAAFVGGTGLGTGIGLGLYARHLHHQQFDDGACQHAKPNDLCSPQGQTQTERARTLGNVGTVVGITGFVVAGVGAYLWLRSPSNTPSDTSDKKLAIVPELSPDGLGVAALGRF